MLQDSRECRELDPLVCVCREGSWFHLTPMPAKEQAMPSHPNNVPRRCRRILLASFISFFLALIAVCHAGTATQVMVNEIFGNDMVIQRDMPVVIYGQADANSGTVDVTWNGSTKSADVKADGLWEVKFEPVPAGGPYALTVAGSETVTFSNILVGEVWVASGQSNIHYQLRPVDPGNAESAKADFPEIRIRGSRVAGGDTPAEESPRGTWKVCTPANAPFFSGTGYYFAKALHQDLGVPVGVIVVALAGSPLERWAPIGTMAGDPVYQAYVDNTLAGGRKYQTATLYNGMIHPLRKLSFRGVIWWQGEANTSRAGEYRTLFQRMIEAWRADCGRGDFPFLFVQLASYWAKDPPSPDGGGSWAAVREAQFATLRTEPNTGMVVAFDVNVSDGSLHPKRKDLVGQRLARCAMGLAYGDKREFQGPLLTKAVTVGAAIRLHFEHVGAGLVLKGDTSQQFAVAGADDVYQWATPTIDGDTILLSSPTVAAPVSARYAFSQQPNGACLWNADGFPASPFRSKEVMEFAPKNNGH